MRQGARARKGAHRAARHRRPRPRRRGAARKPAMRLAAIARLVLVGAIAAAPTLVTSVRSPARDPAVTPLAAVMAHNNPSFAGIAAKFNFNVPSIIAPPPAAVNLPGPLGIPGVAMAAYRNAERVMAREMPGCGVSWNLLAGIGKI